MISGKPQLTFGGGQVNAAGKTRQRAVLSGGNSHGADFASFLPKTDYSNKGSRGFIAAAQPNRLAAANMPSQLLTQASGWNGAFQGAAPAVPAVPSGNQPAGARSLAAARAALNRTPLPAQAQGRAKKAPQISGQPITGRNGIAMVNSRANAEPPAALSGRKPMEVVHPAARQARAKESAKQGQSLLAKQDAFANFGSRHQGALVQSFVTHGFASKNAEQALKNLGYDVNDYRKARLLQTTAGGDMARMAVQTASHRKKPVDLPQNAYSQRSLVPTFYGMANDGLGALAAKFESGSDGIAAIGYDRTGGTSYGKYQISSRAGTMAKFIDYLRDKAPDLAQRLASAGPANTGGRSGRMPTVWRQISEKEPQRFEELQSDFIRDSHFEPALTGIADSTGVGFANLPQALQEVLFSTAVQHGPAGAVRIVSRALERVDKDTLQNADKGKEEHIARAGKQLIKQIYDLRANQFVSSTAKVQSAVRSRLRREMQEAIEML